MSIYLFYSNNCGVEDETINGITKQYLDVKDEFLEFYIGEVANIGYDFILIIYVFNTLILTMELSFSMLLWYLELNFFNIAAHFILLYFFSISRAFKFLSHICNMVFVRPILKSCNSTCDMKISFDRRKKNLFRLINKCENSKGHGPRQINFKKLIQY